MLGLSNGDPIMLWFEIHALKFASNLHLGFHKACNENATSLIIR